MGQTVALKQVPGPPRKAYANGSLPSKVKRFIEVGSDTLSYKTRSHNHRSIINAYLVATFLEEAALCPQSMKRNAGLRDLAQRLHLWPGDIASQLRKDATQAVELLEKYVRDLLNEEMKYANRSATKELEGPEVEGTRRVKEMMDMKEEAIIDLDSLKYELLAQVNATSQYYDEEYELYDLTPFIPGFTSTRNKERSDGWEVMAERDDILAEEQLLSHTKKAALSAIDIYLEKARIVIELRKNIVEDDSLEDLRENLNKMLDIQTAFDVLEDKIFGLLENRDKVQKAWDERFD
jgi:hypothetical protein